MPPPCPLPRSITREALVESALISAKKAEALGLPANRIVISCKVSRVPDLIAVYRDLAARSAQYPHMKYYYVTAWEMAQLVHQAERGVRVITDEHWPVHVSGHPARDELRQMYQWARPHIAVPVHGERRHIKEHARYAMSLQVPMALTPNNGDIIRLAPGSPQMIDEAEAEFEFCNEQSPQSVRLLGGLGYIAYLRGNYEEAVVYLKPAMEGEQIPTYKHLVSEVFEDAKKKVGTTPRGDS